MRDERPIILNPESDARAEEGIGTFFGVIFWLVVVMAVVEYSLTTAWHLATVVLPNIGRLPCYLADS